MKISKPNPNFAVIEKDIKAIKQLFPYVVDSAIGFRFDGNAIDVKTKDAIFGRSYGSGIGASKIKPTTRCRSGFMLLAYIDGEACWIIPDENYSFDLVYIFDV